LRATSRTRSLLTVALLLTATSTFAASIPRTRYHRSTVHHRVRRVYWNPVLRGSRESLLRQNEEINRLQLPRIADDQELQHLIDIEALVPIPASRSVRIDPRLEINRRFCRPWTRDFVGDLGQAYYKQFRQPIQINSAVRTVEQQEHLLRVNRNAAPAEGHTASSHLAGLTVDIAKRGLSRKQRKFIEQYLVKLRSAGLVEAAEERRQAVFHVMVSDRYTAAREADKLASAPHDTGLRPETLPDR
jgi:hypothetical protein